LPRFSAHTSRIFFIVATSDRSSAR
jgi:hypothetical protein